MEIKLRRINRAMMKMMITWMMMMMMMMICLKMRRKRTRDLRPQVPVPGLDAQGPCERRHQNRVPRVAWLEEHADQPVEPEPQRPRTLRLQRALLQLPLLREQRLAQLRAHWLLPVPGGPLRPPGHCRGHWHDRDEQQRQACLWPPAVVFGGQFLPPGAGLPP